MAEKMDVVIWGAGDQGELVKFIFDCYPDVRVRAFLVEDLDQAGSDLLGVPILQANRETLDSLRREGVTHGIASMGNNLLRQQRSEQLESLGFKIANAIHPSAYIPPDLQLGTGVFVDSMSNFSIGSAVGNNVLISITVTIGHHVVIEDNCWISAGAVICARSHLGKNVHIGPGVITVPKNYGYLNIGDGAHIGAGALVLEDIPPNAVAVGSPAKVIRYVTDLTGI